METMTAPVVSFDELKARRDELAKLKAELAKQEAEVTAAAKAAGDAMLASLVAERNEVDNKIAALTAERKAITDKINTIRPENKTGRKNDTRETGEYVAAIKKVLSLNTFERPISGILSDLPSVGLDNPSEGKLRIALDAAMGCGLVKRTGNRATARYSIADIEAIYVPPAKPEKPTADTATPTA